MALASLATLLALFLATVTAPPPLHSSSCGYQSCPKPKEGFLNIHLVPHTHDDVGWLKTYDQYYYGNLMNVQDAGVQYILDSVVQELAHDPQKRFIYVETAYFWKWWLEQSDTVRHQVKKLVNRGQLEFVGGAWSMHDEACTHYQSMLDQTTWGFRRLEDTFGECGRPRVGWQIDPFGHSRENANLMAHYGFDGLFLGRIDWEDKNYRMANKTAEMLWRTSANDKSDASKLFTSVMYNTYSSPKGFCFDINCHDEPIVDNKKSPMYNAEKRASDFVEVMLNYSKSYKTNNVLVTMGDDFMYMSAHMNYKNMDKLIQYVNKIEINGVKMNSFYSTPSCYLKAVHDARPILPNKADDFMPYSSDPMAFWSGYFTSRPTIKYFERMGNNFLQVCKQLYSLAGLGPDVRGDLNAMREAMGVMQHHDAITGTEKQHVARDYARILTDAFKECSDITSRALSDLMGGGGKTVETQSCLLLNISSCPLVEHNDKFVVTLYNPLSRPVNKLVKLPVPHELISYTVLCPMGKNQESQVIKLPESVINIPGRNSTAKAQLVFLAKNIPPLGYRSYYVYKNPNLVKSTKEVELNSQPMKIGFEGGTVIKLNGDGEVTHISVEGKEINLNHEFYYYKGALGNNEIFVNRSSGAYIFRPNGTEIPVSSKPLNVKIFKGPLVNEVHQIYSDWVSQVIRIYKGAKHAEFQWLVGPIPVNDGIGKEVISRFSTDNIHNNGKFLTDSNGREYLLRKLNYRPTWPVHLAEEVPGNYYPITTTLSISNPNGTRLTAVTDRAQGGSSLKDGQLELMVHRRLLHDDAFGVGEALNEIAFGKGLVAIGSHYITTGNLSSTRMLVQERILDSWIFVSPTQGLSFHEWSSTYKMGFKGLRDALPNNVQILTLEPWSGSSTLLRLEHIMEKSDDPTMSKPVTVDLRQMFTGLRISEIEEMMLGANLKVKNSKRLVWTHEGELDDHSHESLLDDSLVELRRFRHLFEITLNPMEIRTFIVRFHKDYH